MILVLDASMALAWLFQRVRPAEAECADRALSALLQVKAVVPLLWHLEVANGALVGERRKIVTVDQVDDFLVRLERLPVISDAVAPAARLTRVLAYARQYGLTVYDASYLDLTLRLGAVLATFDRHLADAARRAGCVVFD